MESRNDAIKQVENLLQESIIDQFHINEVDAALDGDTVFSVKNSIGEQVTLKNNFQAHSESFQYDIVSYTLLMIPEPQTKRRLCNHPLIEKKLHATQYTCLRCGLIADVTYFRNKKEL